MAVEFYKCELCGNIIAVIKNGGGKNLVCCGQPMTHLVANTVDASAEKTYAGCCQRRSHAASDCRLG